MSSKDIFLPITDILLEKTGHNPDKFKTLHPDQQLLWFIEQYQISEPDVQKLLELAILLRLQNFRQKYDYVSYANKAGIYIYLELSKLPLTQQLNTESTSDSQAGINFRTLIPPGAQVYFLKHLSEGIVT